MVNAVNNVCKHDWHFLPGTDRLRCIRCNVETGPRTYEQRVQDMLTVPTAQLQRYKLHDSRPTNSIQFFGNQSSGPSVEILRISKDGIWVNPEVPSDEAAKKVLEAIDHNVKFMVERAVQAEREACALIVEQAGADGYGTLAAAAMIRRGGMP